jgi:nucleoside phosphorylase
MDATKTKPPCPFGTACAEVEQELRLPKRFAPHWEDVTIYGLSRNTRNRQTQLFGVWECPFSSEELDITDRLRHIGGRLGEDGCLWPSFEDVEFSPLTVEKALRENRCRFIPQSCVTFIVAVARRFGWDSLAQPIRDHWCHRVVLGFDGFQERAATAGAMPPPVETDRTRVDVVVVTVKPEEFGAVLKRVHVDDTISRRREWNICRIRSNRTNRDVVVAVVRQVRQGTSEAQAVVRDAIEDLDPAFILMVGIAGAVPGGGLTLGDVVFGSCIHDLTVQEAKADGSRTFSVAGGGVQRGVQVALANLRVSLKPELRRLRLPPPPKVDFKSPKLTTKSADIGRRIREKLGERFGPLDVTPLRRYSPYFTDGEIASSDVLVKDAELVAQWLTFVKPIVAVEMESAGAYAGARTATKEYPMIPVRAISDVIGLKRDDAWTQYACEVAAEFALAFIRTLRAM